MLSVGSRGCSAMTSTVLGTMKPAMRPLARAILSAASICRPSLGMRLLPGWG
jgi:hypothetical protein